MIKMGILGAGTIAGKMADTIAGMDNVEAYAVAARDLKRAEDFAVKHGFAKAYGSYEEMVADDEVDLVYIATPHSHHYKHARLSLEAGRNVLCEKAFTVNARQARELISLAREKKLLITEAIWPRYMPSRKMIDDIVESGVIGDITSLTANLCYEVGNSKRMWDPALAGGALLDLSVYTINFARMVLGENVTEISSSAVFKDGVDMSDSITMIFDGGKMAVLHTNGCAQSDRMGLICGTKGYIQVINMNNPEMIKVFDRDYKEIASYEPPAQITGYEYEVEACIHAIENNLPECPEMPHEETIKVMEIMDSIREAWGYEIPDME